MFSLRILAHSTDETAPFRAGNAQRVLFHGKSECSTDCANVLKVGLVFTLISGFHEFAVEVEGTTRKEKKFAVIRGPKIKQKRKFPTRFMKIKQLKIVKFLKKVKISKLLEWRSKKFLLCEFHFSINSTRLKQSFFNEFWKFLEQKGKKFVKKRILKKKICKKICKKKFVRKIL